MTDKELKNANTIKKRIEELDEEIMALFDARNKRIKPFKPFRVRGFIKSDTISEKEITLTHDDIVLLQQIRCNEKKSLEKILRQMGATSDNGGSSNEG